MKRIKEKKANKGTKEKIVKTIRDTSKGMNNNIFGEILDCPKINVKVHCQMLPVFARGPAAARLKFA